MTRYQFGDFTLVPRQRVLLRGGRELPLIPRYFDLLVYLVEHRHEAVHRRDIFEHVWNDVVVSDSALTQAIRTLRQALEDDSREPRFIRTISRHGYQFVHQPVVQQQETAQAAVETVASPPVAARIVDAAGRAAVGGGAAGCIGGIGGGLLLMVAPGSTAPFSAIPVLVLIGTICGAIGGIGVGGGTVLARALITGSYRVAMIAGGALGGGAVGFLVEWLARWTLAGLVGARIEVGGGIEGLVIGSFAGLGLMAGASLASSATRGSLTTVLSVAAACALGALALAALGRPLVGGTIHNIAVTSSGAQIVLTPLGRLIGDPAFGPVTRGLIAAGEGALFGAGLAIGLGLAARSPKSHIFLTRR